MSLFDRIYEESDLVENYQDMIGVLKYLNKKELARCTGISATVWYNLTYGRKKHFTKEERKALAQFINEKIIIPTWDY